MKREDTRELDEVGSGAIETDRRNFLRKSLGAVPIVLTVGNRPGWGGHSVHGTLWSSGGTDWKYRGGGLWRDRGWDKPPRFGHHDDYPKGGDHEAEPPKGAADWDWQSPRVEWRKWRPDADEVRDSDSRSPNWEWRKWSPHADETQKWGQDERQAPTAKDIPVSPIDETIRPKD